VSVSYQAARTEDCPQFFTIGGLAATFGISTGTIRKYIQWGHVDRAVSRRADGFNYDISHYRQIKRVRAAKLPLYHGRNRQAHVVVVSRATEPVAA
jgi:hypothetical protein